MKASGLTTVLRLTASDTGLTGSDDVAVTQTPPPAVAINSPADGSTVTGPTNLVGTVSDGSAWRLEYSFNEEGVAPAWTRISALNAVYSGADFRLIREQLQRECGPPAPDIPGIYVRKEVVVAGKPYQCFSGEGYFVERFDT